MWSVLLVGIISCTQEKVQNTKMVVADSVLSITEEPEGEKASQYLPAYSSIAISGGRKTIPLTITVSFRNMDESAQVTITRVAYYDSDGTLVRDYLMESQTLDALSSAEFIVPERDLTGGTGASFVIDYYPETKNMSTPIIHGVHINSNSGISFITKGIVHQR